MTIPLNADEKDIVEDKLAAVELAVQKLRLYFQSRRPLGAADTDLGGGSDTVGENIGTIVTEAKDLLEELYLIADPE